VCVCVCVLTQCYFGITEQYDGTIDCFTKIIKKEGVGGCVSVSVCTSIVREHIL